MQEPAAGEPRSRKVDQPGATAGKDRHDRENDGTNTWYYPVQAAPISPTSTSPSTVTTGNSHPPLAPPHGSSSNTNSQIGTSNQGSVQMAPPAHSSSSTSAVVNNSASPAPQAAGSQGGPHKGTGQKSGLLTKATLVVIVFAAGVACTIGLVLVAAFVLNNIPDDSGLTPNNLTVTDSVLYSENFERDSGGYTRSGSITTLHWGSLEGNKVWITNLTGNYTNSEDGYIVSPIIDLTGGDGDSVVLEWNQRKKTEEKPTLYLASQGFDFCSVSVSNDAGNSWHEVYRGMGGDWTWETGRVVLNSSYKVPNARLKFCFSSDRSNTDRGYCIDNITIYSSKGGVVVTPLPNTGGSTAEGDTGDSTDSTPKHLADFAENFEYGSGGFTSHVNTSHGMKSSWEWGSVGDSFAWKTNIRGNYSDNESGFISSPPVDLAAYDGRWVVIDWHQKLQTEKDADFGYVRVSRDGGVNWVEVYRGSGGSDWSWESKQIVLDSSYKVPDFRVAFGFTSNTSQTGDGYCIDDVKIRTAESV